MKIPLKYSSLVLLPVLAISQATAAPLGFLEKFAISENREDALKELDVEEDVLLSSAGDTVEVLEFVSKDGLFLLRS